MLFHVVPAGGCAGGNDMLVMVVIAGVEVLVSAGTVHSCDILDAGQYCRRRPHPPLETFLPCLLGLASWHCLFRIS